MPNVGIVCFLMSYLVAMAAQLIRFRSGSVWWVRTAAFFTAAGFVAQTLYLLLRAQQTRLPPLLSSLHDWLLVLAWLLVLLDLLLAVSRWLPRGHNRPLDVGAAVLPLVLAMVGASWFVPMVPSQLLDANRGWKMLHAALLVLGMATVAVGLLTSFVYLWQHWRLKGHARWSSGMALPSLEWLSLANRWAILLAVPLLTLGMLSGVALSVLGGRDLPAKTWVDPVVLGGMASWLVMCTLLFWTLRNENHPGRQVAWLTVCACGFLLFSVVGLQVLTGVTGSTSVHGAGPKPAGHSSSAPQAGEASL